VIENQKIVPSKKLPIIFVGMPGSGKTTVANLISEKLNLPFIDTDLVFQSKYSTTPNDVISKFGEIRFREMEAQVLNDLIRYKEIVLATGGGLPCFNNQMKILNDWGTTVFLDCKPVLLAQRLKNNSARPLLEGNIHSKLNLLYQSRLPIYNKAHIIVPAAFSVNDLIENLMVELM
jgi:shikimate kinase